MADVVCWVQDEGDRFRVVWSSGPTTFPPYFLTPNSRDDIEGLARTLESNLGVLLGENTPQAALELARAGHRLYRFLFQADAPSA